MSNALAKQFEELAHQLRQLIALLEESEDPFWISSLQRGLHQVDAHHLAGATFVLGCYGGENTFSDVTIGRQWQQSHPLKYQNANARLISLRNKIFTSADAIASRRHW